jgi:hypothetical protein
MEREYRRTHDIPDRAGRQEGVSSTKYELLLNKLQESLLGNDALEEAIEERDERIGDLKGVVRSMWEEIQNLQSALDEERGERIRMSAALEDLAGRIQFVRSSKEKDRGHYIPTHQKRNSHIPRSNSRSREEFFNRSELESILQDRSNQMVRREREESGLRKKGKTHKYKISDCFEQPVNIYENSFQ